MTHHRYDSYNLKTTKRLQEYSLEFQRFLGATGCKTSLPVGRLVDDHTPDPMDRGVRKIKLRLLGCQAVSHPGDRLYDERIRGIVFDLTP
jgi:hypothetical protein